MPIHKLNQHHNTFANKLISLINTYFIHMNTKQTFENKHLDRIDHKHNLTPVGTSKTIQQKTTCTTEQISFETKTAI